MKKDGVEEGSSGRFESEDVGHLLGLELAQLRGGSYGYQQQFYHKDTSPFHCIFHESIYNGDSFLSDVRRLINGVIEQISGSFSLSSIEIMYPHSSQLSL